MSGPTILTPVGVAQAVSYSDTAGSSASLFVGATGVWVWCTTDAYLAVGAGITATATNGTPVPAYTPVVLPILAPREGIRISALRVSANGTMYLRPMGGAG